MLLCPPPFELLVWVRVIWTSLGVRPPSPASSGCPTLGLRSHSGLRVPLLVSLPLLSLELLVLPKPWSCSWPCLAPLCSASTRTPCPSDTHLLPPIRSIWWLGPHVKWAFFGFASFPILDELANALCSARVLLDVLSCCRWVQVPTVWFVAFPISHEAPAYLGRSCRLWCHMLLPLAALSPTSLFPILFVPGLCIV